jgi:hypothetical protein
MGQVSDFDGVPADVPEEACERFFALLRHCKSMDVGWNALNSSLSQASLRPFRERRNWRARALLPIWRILHYTL